LIIACCKLQLRVRHGDVLTVTPASAADGRAVCAMTGGLNSGITALLAHRALGDRLQCIFVDTGLLRENEAAQVMRFYRDQMA